MDADRREHPLAGRDGPVLRGRAGVRPPRGGVPPCLSLRRDRPRRVQRARRLRALRRRRDDARGVPPLREPARAAAGRAALEPAAPVHRGASARCAAARSTASASTRGASTTRCWTRTHRVLGLPFHYRDERTDGVQRVEGYEITGIQHMPINTVYQLLADDSRRATRDRIALVPDLLAYWLCGELANERTNASTTGLLDARTGEWSTELIERLGLPTRAVRATLVEPGTLLGRARASRARRARLHGRLARHRLGLRRRADLRDEHSAILSSGTWSLLGPRARRARLHDDALTNERGVDGTIRLLKNVMGLWLEQECARVWDASFPELQRGRARGHRRRADLRPRRRALPARRRHARADRGGHRPRRPDPRRDRRARSTSRSPASTSVVLERLEAASGPRRRNAST